jgi:hypothetical protein
MKYVQAREGFVRNYQTSSPEDRRKFDGWLDANLILGSIFAIGMLAMAWAGYNSVGPDAAIAAAKIETIAH